MTESFWTFSLRFYQHPNVAEACIELQDRHGADVNLLLFALWAASNGHLLATKTIATADHTAKQWRETVIHPLRAARRALRTAPNRFDASEVAKLRQQVMAAELESERLQQEAMARDLTLDARAPSLAAAQQNLSRYETFLEEPFAPEPIERLLQAFITQSNQAAHDGDYPQVGAPVPKP